MQHAILSAVVTAGILAVGICAPNALQVLALLEKNSSKKRKTNPRYILNKTLKQLIRDGLIKEVYKNNVAMLEPTEKGEKLFRLLELRNFQLKKPIRWDKKWRIVIFDVYEHKRDVRDMLRGVLQQVGFKHLQHSVWIYPHECEKVVALIKTYFGISQEVLYIVADKIENDEFLIKHFGL